MSWTTPADVRAQVQRLWERGDLLRATVSDDAPWPLRLNLKTPSAADLSDRFDAVRDWVRVLADTPHVRIDWRDWNHRVQGMQRLPAAIWLDTLPAALALVRQAKEARRFGQLWEHTATTQPLLLPWLHRRPLQALELAQRWERLLAVVAWLQAHPRPGVYLRQVDAPGVDSKFIEAHRGVLTEWLDLALPAEAIDTSSAARVAQFASRYGFRDKPWRIRFRTLDPAVPTLPGCHDCPDVTLDAASFAMLALPIDRVFITENETNFLAFPPQANAMVVFGAGYGWDALAPAAWLRHCTLHYWGDIDTHGFAILNQLRDNFPHTASFMMDHDTLLAHRAHWGEEPDQVRHALPRLTAQEVMVYDALRLDQLQVKLRLEQERIGYGWLCERLARIGGSLGR